MINRIAFIPREVLRFADELENIANEIAKNNSLQWPREITKQQVGNFLASICDDARSILILTPELRRLIEEINDGDCEEYEANEKRVGIIHTGRNFEVIPLRDALKQDRPFLRIERGYYSYC